MSLSTDVRQTSLDDYLRQPAHYPERTRHVDVVETHISWVFLTDRFAYKLKKPVRFDFLDFSTPAARRAACLTELRLNRRLAPDVYLDVIGMEQSTPGHWTWSAGDATEWLVKMKRLPAEASLEDRLKRGAVSERELEALADFFAEFYRQQPPLTLVPQQVRQRLAAAIGANQRELASDDAPHLAQVRDLHQAQLDFVKQRAELLDSRVCDGRFIEGHGDLRPEHIYLMQKPAIIDCIEFSSDLRQLDIVDELSFLAMECDRLGHPAIGERILGRYATAAGDDPPAALIAFYKMYRACVRAKVLILRSIQTQGEQREKYASESERYLTLATNYLPQLRPQRLLVVCGLMGTGKSTLAQELATHLQARHQRTDEVRQSLLGDVRSRDAFGSGRYNSHRRDQVYDELYRRTAELLAKGHTVIADGSFGNAEQRRRMREIAQECNITALFFECTCPRDLALRRLDHRHTQGTDPSEGRPELYDHQRADWQPAGADEQIISIDTSLPMAHQVEQVDRQLNLASRLH